MNHNRSSSPLTLLIAIVSLLGLGVVAGAVAAWGHEDAAFLVNSSLLTMAISLETGRSPAGIWNANFRWALPHFVIQGFLAVFMAATYDRWELWGLAIILGPLAMAWQAMKQYTDRLSGS